MLWPNVKDRFFLCPKCGPTGDAAFQEWVQLLAEIPLVHEQWDFSNLLWFTNTCPNCGAQLPDAFHPGPALKLWDSDSQLFDVLEWFAREGKQSAHLSRASVEKCYILKGSHLVLDEEACAFPAMGPGYSQGYKRSGFFFELVAWVALAVASGVIGNVAYDSIKNAVLNGRRKALEKRKDRPPRGEDSSPLEKNEEYMKPHLQEWDAMSDDDLEKQVHAMHEYAKQRLRNVRLRRSEDKRCP